MTRVLLAIFQGVPTLRLVGILSLFGIGWGAAAQFDLKVELHGGGDAAAGERTYQPAYDREAGQQLVMVYVGSGSCAWSNRDSLPAAVESLKLRLADYAQSQELSFKVIGVAIDWSTDHGAQHLSKFGTFDEVSVGYNWGNSLALDFLWSDPGVRPSTPQILVYERQFIAPQDTLDALFYAEAERKRLGAATGAQQILDWAETERLLPEPQGSATQFTDVADRWNF